MAVFALGVTIVPLASLPAQASAISCPWYMGNEAPYQLYNAGGSTHIVRTTAGWGTPVCWYLSGSGSLFYIQQSGTNLCMTWNASKSYVDEITCQGLVSQTWFDWANQAKYGLTYEELANAYTAVRGDSWCLSASAVGAAATMKTCAGSKYEFWTTLN